MTHPILSMLPYEAQATSFEKELVAEEIRNERDRRKAGVGRLMDVTLSLLELWRSTPAVRRK